MSPETPPLPSPEQTEPLPEAPPRRWTPADRKALLLWLTVGLILPGIIVIALASSLGIDLKNATLTVGLELRLKGASAFFVLLATWIASRVQQRPLGTYGIPPAQALGALFLGRGGVGICDVVAFASAALGDGALPY